MQERANRVAELALELARLAATGLVDEPAVRQACLDHLSKLPPAEEPTDSQSEWLTIAQAARHLGVTSCTIRRWSNQGDLPAFHTPGGHRRYRRIDLDDFLARSGPPRSQARPSLLLLNGDGLREAS